MLSDVERVRFALPGRGVELAALVWDEEGAGRRPLALLHHANGFCAALWAPVAERLRARFRVVAVDARGHGDSSKPEGEGAYTWDAYARDLAELAGQLAAEQGEPIALGLGHSFGGTTVLTAAGRHPDLFRAVLATDPILHRRETRDGRTRGSEAGKELASGALRRRVRFPSKAEAYVRFSPRETFAAWQPGLLDLYLEEGFQHGHEGDLTLKCPGRVEAAIFGSDGSNEVWASAPGFLGPAQIQVAEGGDVPEDLHHDLARSMANAHVEVVPTGHFVPMERPDLVAASALQIGLG